MSIGKFSAQKRQNILAIATELFLEKGFSGASTSELLRRVGGSKTTIYSHFGDKAGLFTAVVDEVLKETLAYSDIRDLTELSTRAALITIADQYLKIVLSSRYISLVRIVVAEVNRFPEIGKAFYAHGPGKSYSNFESFLKQRTKSGELRITSLSLATDLFFGTLLHRELLVRMYGVKKSPPRNRTIIATAVADEFIKHYTNTI